MNIFFGIIFFAGFAAYFIGWPIWVASTTPEADLSRINAHYGGSYTKVVSITRAGMQLFTRSSPNYRKYDIVLQRLSDEPFQKTVGVAAGFLGPGELIEYDANGLSFRSKPVDY